MPETWQSIGSDSRKAAAKLVREKHFRSAAARAYYAAFSKITQDLLAAGLQTAPGSEGFGHSRIRKIIQTSMPDSDQMKRRTLSHMLGRLYTLRIYADYRPSKHFDKAEAREAVSLMNKIFEKF